MADWNDVADDWVKHADQNDYRNARLMPLAARDRERARREGRIRLRKRKRLND